MSANLVCDFCSKAPVTARYQADDIAIIAQSDAGVLVNQSAGDWAACHVCEVLIDAGHWDMLLDRAVETMYLEHPEMRGVPRAIVRDYLDKMYTVLRNETNFKKVKL